MLLPGALLLTLQAGGPVFGFLQLLLQQPMVGSQGSQFVLLVPNVDSSRLESLFLSVATGQNAEADLLVSRELCLDQSEPLPERNDFVAALQGGGRPLARATAGNDTRGINQFPVLRGKGCRGMTSTQLGGVIEIGRERDSVQNASHETVQIVAFAANTVGGPTKRALGGRSGCGKMVAVGRHHAGASQLVLVKRFENFAGRGLVGDNDGVTARTERGFDGGQKPGFHSEQTAEHAADSGLEMVGAVESAQHSLRTRGGAFALEVELLEHFESGLDLREVALRVGHFLLDALTLQLAPFDLSLRAVQGGLRGVKRFRGRGDLSGCLFKTLPACGLCFENLTCFVLEGLDAHLCCFPAGLKSGQLTLQAERLVFRLADLGAQGLHRLLGGFAAAGAFAQTRLQGIECSGTLGQFGRNFDHLLVGATHFLALHALALAGRGNFLITAGNGLTQLLANLAIVRGPALRLDHAVAERLHGLAGGFHLLLKLAQACAMAGNGSFAFFQSG